MHKGFHKTSPHLCGIAALFVLMFSSAQAGNYQPMQGSFRPPLLGDTSTNQSGFRQDNSQFITAPSQQQAWTSQPYGSSSNYYLPAPQPAATYPGQAAQPYSYQPPIQQAPVYPQQQYYYGSSLPLQYGYTAQQIQQPAATYLSQPAQPPVYQPPIQQAPVYPQQQQYYGSSYPQQYSYTVPQIQQQPTVMPPSQPVQQPVPFTRRPFGGKDGRFRPPELKGTD